MITLTNGVTITGNVQFNSIFPDEFLGSITLLSFTIPTDGNFRTDSIATPVFTISTNDGNFRTDNIATPVFTIPTYSDNFRTDSIVTIPFTIP